MKIDFFPKPFLTVVLVAIFSCLASSKSRAQVASITLGTPSVAFGTLTLSDIESGFKETSPSSGVFALQVTVRTPNKKQWTLYTSAATPNFSAATGLKPSGELQWRVDGLGAYTSYTTADVVTATGTNTANARVDFDFKLLTGWADIPDTYNLNVVFTLTQP